MRLPWLELAGVGALAAATIASGGWLVGAKHQARQLFWELEELNREQDRLLVDWGRLQIEQGMLATHARIEPLVRERLKLTMPDDDALRIVFEPPAQRSTQ